jgi:NADH dehydrogenase (ubiquinone) Fe-S protein 4
MSVLRPAFRQLVAPARAFSTSVARAEAYTPPARWSTDHVAPADVVAGKAAGPATVHDTAKEITIEVTSDAPQELQHRQVRIFKPTKNTMQSAKGKTKVWRIDFDVLQGAGRWTNPLMGWASSADYMQGTSLAFRTREDAVGFVSL